MLKTGTANVFVVGAGASREFGLPTGRELLDQIARIAHAEDHHIVFSDSPPHLEGAKITKAIEAYLSEGKNTAVGITGDRLNEAHKAALEISTVAPLAPSIDNFLDARRESLDIRAVGKVMIAHILLAAEVKSSLARVDLNTGLYLGLKAVPPHGNFRAAESWLGELFWLLAEGRQFNEFVEALLKTSFICFNYDRCIEHFLINAACLYYGRDTDSQVNRAETINSALNIIRPYGSLGDLKIEQDRAVGFGTPAKSLYESSKSIRTFTESGEGGNFDDDIKKAFEGLPRVFFLGFGYLDLNLKKIFGDNSYTVGEVLGTAKGISSHSKDVIEGKLHKSLKGRVPERLRPVELPHERISLHDATCQGLIQTYSHYLRDHTR